MKIKWKCICFAKNKMTFKKMGQYIRCSKKKLKKLRDFFYMQQWSFQAKYGSYAIYPALAKRFLQAFSLKL